MVDHGLRKACGLWEGIAIGTFPWVDNTAVGDVTELSSSPEESMLLLELVAFVIAVPGRVVDGTPPSFDT